MIKKISLNIFFLLLVFNQYGQLDFYSGNYDKPEFSSVSASTFGLITILLVCSFFKEKLNRIQIFGIILVFCSIATLSFG